MAAWIFSSFLCLPSKRIYTSQVHVFCEGACKEDAKKAPKHLVILSVISPPVLLSLYSFYIISQCVSEMPSRYISSFVYSIQFCYMKFVDFTPEIINSAACGEAINFAGLWCILKTLMSLLLMYLSQRDQAFKITLVLFFAPFFFFSFWKFLNVLIYNIEQKLLVLLLYT